MKKIIILCFLTFHLLSASGVKEKLQQIVSPKFNGASITEVLKLFARQNGLNLVVSGDVKGRVSVQLNRVTLADALNSILKSMGYHYVVDNDVLIVKPFNKAMNGERVTRIFQLKYLNAFFLMNTITPLLSKKGKMVPLLPENGKNEKDLRSNILLVTDLWENIQQINTVVKELDVVQKQILIEVRLIETLVGNQEQYGLNLPKKIGVSVDGAETTAPISATSSNNSNPRLLSAWYKLPNGSSTLNLGVLSVNQLTASLDMLAKDNGSRLVSNPRVVVLDNHRAHVKIGTTVPIPEVSRGVGGDLISYREKEVNIDLEVIPQINADNKITLDVHPILEEIIGYTGASDAPQPITSKREVNTTVTVENAQTLVLGGLIKETRTKTTEKIWLLGDIPILGYLFQNTVTKKEKSDLYIFITPRVIQYKGTVKK